MSDDNGEKQAEPVTAPLVRRVILEYDGDNLKIGAQQCSPELVEATLLRGLAFIQRELATLRLMEAWNNQTKQELAAAELKRRIDGGRR